MNKILNARSEYVNEMMEGLCAAHPHYLRQSPDSARVLLRVRESVRPQVGIVSGGGSGHMPLFHGYLGTGLLSACAVGNVFAGPRVDDCAIAMRASEEGVGVLQLYGNYGGDRMNFDMARELLELEDMKVATVLVTDDVASAPAEEHYKRRGVAGLIYAYKIAGARAAEGASLEDVARAAFTAVENCRSIGIALSPCVIPESGKISFEAGEGEVQFGMGIHGEPGIWHGPMQTADALTSQMMECLLAELPVSRTDRVSVLVNSLGSTPLEELYIMYRRISQILKDRGVKIVSPLIGRFATSMEMGGASISLLRLDETLENLLLAPANCVFWRVQ